MNIKKIIAPIGSAIALLSSAGVAFAAPGIAGPFAVGKPIGFASDANGLINFLLKMVLAVGALLVFGFLVSGGIQWITSGGDKGKTESARNTITAAVIGLIILASSWAILSLVLTFLGFGSINEVLNAVGTI